MVEIEGRAELALILAHSGQIVECGRETRVLTGQALYLPKRKEVSLLRLGIVSLLSKLVSSLDLIRPELLARGDHLWKQEQQRYQGFR